MLKYFYGSNHPPSILKNIPESINSRLSRISSSEKVFNNSKRDYQDALKRAGYKEQLTYQKDINVEISGSRGKRKNRKRHITWYNPPYSKNVETNIGKEFFRLVTLHFPKHHPLHCLFNKNTVKLSYSCMMNMDSIVKAHNKKTLAKDNGENKRNHI